GGLAWGAIPGTTEFVNPETGQVETSVRNEMSGRQIVSAICAGALGLITLVGITTTLDDGSGFGKLNLEGMRRSLKILREDIEKVKKMKRLELPLGNETEPARQSVLKVLDMRITQMAQTLAGNLQKAYDANDHIRPFLNDVFGER